VGVEDRVVERLVTVSRGVCGVVHENGGSAEPFDYRVEQTFGRLRQREVQLYRPCPDVRVSQLFEQRLRPVFVFTPVGKVDIRAFLGQRSADRRSYSPAPARSRHHSHASAQEICHLSSRPRCPS
jgi:hypothetical protein